MIGKRNVDKRKVLFFTRDVYSRLMMIPILLIANNAVDDE
jgi:hypothetical protein